VTVNVAPRLMHQMSHAALNGAESQARELNQKLMALHTELFCESNPIPSKWALAQMGLIKEGIRLPLTPLTPRYHEQVLRALQQAHVLSA
jgi:4-hydroxy-tetrahydrodipicolinate synthase